MATIIPQPTTPVSSVSVTPNRSLLKNIKNIPVTSAKKQQQGKFVTVSSTPTNKKNNLANGSSSIKKNNNVMEQNFLFTTGTPFSLTVPKQQELSPVKELTTSDLVGLASPKVVEKSSSFVAQSDDIDIVPAPSSSVSSKPSIRYTIDFLKSLQGVSASMSRPKELDYIEDSQREAALMQSAYSSTVSASGGSSLYGSHHKVRTPLFGSVLSDKNFVSPSPYKSASPMANGATPFSLGSISPAHQFNLSLNGDSALGVIPMQLRHPPLPLPLSVPLPVPSLAGNSSSLHSSTSSKKASSKQNKLVDNKSSASGMDQSNPDSAADQLVEGMKKVLKEDNPKRLQARQRQIDIGKATVGYKTYSSSVSKSKRKKSDPKTPNKNQICSKRSWDGQVRKWRRLLHQYDPVGTPMEDMMDEDLEDAEDLEDDEDVEDIEINNQQDKIPTSISTPLVNTSIPQISSIYDNITPEMLSSM